MRTQQIVKFSLILSVLSIFIFSFSYFGLSVFSARSAANQAFSENTMIGSIDVSNKSHDEAMTQIKTKVNSWMSEANISLVYKGQTFPIDTSGFVFLVEDSVSSAADGEQNELYVEWKDGELGTLPSSVKDKLDAENLKIELQTAVRELPAVIEIKLDNYLPAEEPVIISTASVMLSPKDELEVRELIEGLNPIEILPDSMFSLAAYAEETGQAEASATVYSQIASALYKAVLQSNITISERHISGQLPENVELGYEARVDLSNNLDLKLYNPNESPYKIAFAVKGQELQVAVTGVPQIYIYKVTATGKQEFKPRIIKQYSPLLKQGQKSVERDGKAGLLIKINREIYGENGELLKNESISEDYYPPSPPD